MPTERRCATCGAALAPFGAEALCPKCMLHEALGLHAHLTAGREAASKGSTAVVTPVTEKPGDRIGRYKLLQQIGEGGMGVVYMAEQEEAVRRRVALKVIKLGMDTKSVIARFEAERQTLALMDHPNIAKVFDAGATDTGRPYFVMELVRGIRITDYCDQNHLSTQQRLDLFTQTCKAIQHAHQKGIIHRDIKPSNILITLHDGVPVPKIIDFGIAKATSDQRLTDKTLFTAFEQFIGTPAYMSPEQAEMSGLDIDTRSDIYSLGVLLYELLTGRTPFDANELLEAGLDEMRRTIREKEPPKPSTVVERLNKLRVERGEAPSPQGSPALNSQLKSLSTDLDWIVMKALEKDRARRYETANALTMDIQRHLENEPVVARPPSAAYRFQKLVRRNKVAFAATSAVIAALILGLGLSTWLFLRERAARHQAVGARKEAEAARQNEAKLRQQAEHEEQKAKTEASKSDQVAAFLQDMLNSVGPSVALGRDTTMLREILDKTAERVSKDLKDQPAVEGELRNTIGAVYWALGQYEKAEAMLRETLGMRRKLLGDEHPDVATSLNNLATVLHDQGRLAEAETMQREALAMRRKVLGNEHPDVANTLGALALVLHGQGKLVEAETMQREALATQRKLLGNEHPDVANSLNSLAGVLLSEGKLAEAGAMHREALVMQRILLGNEHPSVATSLHNLASVLADQGKLAEAEAMHREVLVMQRKLFGNEHPSVATSLHNLATLLSQQGKLAEAETMSCEALGMLRKLLGDEHPTVATSLNNVARVLERQGRLAEAETMHREALAMHRKLLGNEHPSVAQSLNNLALTLYRQEKLAEAETMHREALALKRKLLGDEHPEVANSLNNLAMVFYAQGKLAEAESMFREALAMERKLLANEHPSVADSLNNLASVLERQRKWAEAETMFREALALRKRLSGDEHPNVAQSLNGLANVLFSQHKYVEVEQLFSDLLTPAIQNQPGSAGMLRSRGIFRARRGQWKEAAADLTKAMELNPRDHWNWYQLAPLWIESGDVEAYRQHCQQFLTHFVGGKDPNIAERLAKDCLILPASGVDHEVVGKLADTVIAAAEDHRDSAWFQLLKGWAEYRQGHFASAAEWLQKVVSRPKEADRDVQAHMVMAMAQHQLKHAAEAREMLVKGLEIAEAKLPKLESGDLGDRWHDWIIAHALMREAKALIEDSAKPGSEAK